jgi:hypothetical protein
MSYRIYKNSIKQKTSNSLFEYVLRVCNFYNPKIFNEQIYPKKWIDPKFVSKITSLRKDKKILDIKNFILISKIYLLFFYL